MSKKSVTESNWSINDEGPYNEINGTDEWSGNQSQMPLKPKEITSSPPTVHSTVPFTMTPTLSALVTSAPNKMTPTPFTPTPSSMGVYTPTPLGKQNPATARPTPMSTKVPSQTYTPGSSTPVPSNTPMGTNVPMGTITPMGTNVPMTTITPMGTNVPMGTTPVPTRESFSDSSSESKTTLSPVPVQTAYITGMPTTPSHTQRYTKKPTLHPTVKSTITPTPYVTTSPTLSSSNY